jgi:hypothetical protein
MAYTSVPSVSAMLPSFVRGNPQQAPTDANITIWITDVSGEIDAVLLRRFSEAINASPYSGNFAAWQAGLAAEATAILEKINRYGAAAQLLLTLATLGSVSTIALAKSTQISFRKMWNDLNAVDDEGRPLACGLYDSYFDPLSRVSTPRPGLTANPGPQPGFDTPGEFLFRIHQVI